MLTDHAVQQRVHVVHDGVHVDHAIDQVAQQLAASGNFGQVIRRNYPVAVGTRMGEGTRETVQVVGCLCTPLDLLADEVPLPHAEPGDVVAIFCAGAYGLTASPQAFLGQPAAREMLV